VSGWTQPQGGTAGPIVGWETPVEPEGLGVRESLSAGWRLMRAHIGSLAAIAVIPEVLRNLLLLPMWLLYWDLFAAQIRFFADLDWSRYVTDPEGVQRELEAIFRVPLEQALASAIGGGLSITVWLIGIGAVTAGTLAAAERRRPSVQDAWRTVTAHPGSLLAPAVMLGLAWGVLSLPLTLSQGMMSTGSMNPVGALLGTLAGLVTLAVGVGVLVLIVRWAVVYQVILGEDLGLAAALRRSAQLTAGVRTKIGLALIALGFVAGLVVSMLAFAVGFVAWLVTSSSELTIVSFVGALIVGGLVYVPWATAIVTHIYRQRIEPGPATPPLA
jgi:hypothetical protein